MAREILKVGTSSHGEIEISVSNGEIFFEQYDEENPVESLSLNINPNDWQQIKAFIDRHLEAK
jgi:L-asparaginase/Glu-tRNA(Gln) amidotransferase subunit D